MKKIFLLLAILISPILAQTANAGSNSGDYIFSLGHKGVQGKEQILFNSFATEEVAEGQKASINWSLNKLDTSFSILIDGNAVSTNEIGDFDFYPEKTTEVTISLFDNAKNKVIEEHDHVISVFGAPKITSLTADSEIVKPNSNVVLRWTGENLGTISFSPLAVAINKGSAIVKPSVNTTYVMTATNAMGLFDTKEISIATSEYIPEITSFTIDKQEVYRGQPVNLTWTSKDSESVDFFINGESVQKGLAANGTLSYDATTTGVQSLQLRPKDKYYGLYGLVKSSALTVKESDSWDFLPRLITDASIKTGQSLDFEWAAGVSAKSITISYKTNVASDWTVLPITKLAGTYSLPIKENGASSATIKFDLIKSNDALVSSSITGSLITTSIDKTRLSSGSSAILSVSQGINYPLSVYVDDVKSKTVYNGVSSISLGANPGEHVIEIRTNGASEKVIDTYKVTVLPTWVRTPDLSRSVMYAGDTTVLSWSVAEPFVSASVKRTSNLGTSTIDRLAASGSMTDTLIAGETYVKYDVTVTTANNESLTSSVDGYLASSSISISEAGFGQDVPVAFLSSTPSKMLYVDGIQKKSLSGTSYNVTGLSVGVHNIEIKSLYGKFPLNNRVYSKEITVLPSDNIEIQSDFVIVETGKGFVWSWYVPEQYDNVEVIENNGATSTVSTSNDGTYASEMKSNSGATLTVKASSNGGAVITKTLSIDAFFISGLLDEYSYTESPYITIYAPGGLSFYINDVLWTGVSGSALFNYTIPYSKLAIGFNNIRFESRSSKSGQKMDITKSLTRLNDITLTLDNNIAPVGGITGASWSVPSEFTDVKVTRKVSGVDEVVSINKSGNHSAAMTNSSVVYTLEGTTKLGKKSSTSKTIHYYSVALDAQLDDKANTMLTLTSSTNASFYLNVNGQRKSSYSSSTKGTSTWISYSNFETGENNLVIEPISLTGMNYETTISRLSESKNPQKLAYDYVITGEKNTYSWDVTTEYSIVKVTHNNVLVSTENAGSYDYPQISGTETLSIYTETPDGYSQTKTLTSRNINQSTTREITDYNNATTVYYSPYNSSYVKIAINGKDWTSIRVNGNQNGYSISPSQLEYGENEITFTPESASIMPWKSRIKKLETITASANYDVALIGTKIEYTWDIPDEYATFKIESTVGNVKTVLPNDRSGSYSHSKSDKYTDSLVITGTNTNGVDYVKTVIVKYLNVVPRANRITASETYYLDVTGTFYGASIYVNDKLSRTISSPNVSVSFNHREFNTDGVNTITVIPNGDDGRVASWAGEIIAFKEPSLTSDFDYIAPTDIATYRWNADDSIYETVSITHYKNSVPSVISTDKTGVVDTIKVLSDKVVMNAVTFTGEVYNKTIVIKDMDAYISNPIVYQGVGAQIIAKSYITSDTFDYYINGDKYANRTAYQSYYSGFSIPTSKLNDGDNEIKLVYTGTNFKNAKDWVFNVEKKPDMVIDSDYEQLLVGDNEVTFNWDIPSVYSDLSIKLNNVEISSSYNGSYTYKPTAIGYIYLKITAKTEEGGAANTEKRVTAYSVEMRPYSNEGDSINDVEIAESNGPKVIYKSPQTSTNAKIFVNGVIKSTISNGSTNTLSTNYFQLGENTIEIFSDDALEDGMPSSKHLYFTGSVSMSKRAIVTSGAQVTIKDNVVSFNWDTFGEYDSVEVKTVINGETKIISTDKSGDFQYTRTSASYDSLSVDVKKGDIEYTVSAGSGGAVYELDRHQVSTSQRTLLKSEMYTYGQNVYSEVYVNGIYKNRIESATKETRYGPCCDYPKYYVWVKKSNTNSYIEPSWLNSGENEIQIKLYNNSNPVQVWTSSITKVETPVITADIDLLHIGEVATFSWNAESAFNDVKVTLKKDGVLMDISNENSGSYSFIKEKGSDTIYMTATGDDGLSYSTSRQIYYMSVLFPAIVASGQSVSYYYESSYPGAQVYVNGVSTRTMTTSGSTFTDPASYFHVGDNMIEVVQTGSFAATAKKWEGKVIVAEAPEFSVNYSMVHIGDVVTVNWDAPSLYETVKVTRSNASGVEVLSDSASSGTVSYIKEAMDDTISISASNGSGATYSSSKAVKYMSVLFPATIQQGVDAPYTFMSSDGKAKVYVNDVLIRTISGSANANYGYSIPKSNLNIGNNKIEVLSNGAYIDTAKAWIGNVIVTE